MLGKRKKHESEQRVEQLEHAFDNACKLVDVTQDGRTITFVFLCNGETFTVETFAAMSVNVPAIREKAGVPRP